MARPVRLGTGARALRGPRIEIPGAIATWPDSSDMNRTEHAYAATVLEPALKARDILWYAFEPWKLRLGPKNFYTVDFGVVTADRRIQCHEVKAVWSSGKVGFKDDARQKVRDAAQMFPFFSFIVAARRSKSAMRKAGTSEEWLYEYILTHTTRPPPT